MGSPVSPRPNRCRERLAPPQAGVRFDRLTTGGETRFPRMFTSGVAQGNRLALRAAVCYNRLQCAARALFCCVAEGLKAMASKKGNRIVIKLKSTESGHTYTTMKNRRNDPSRLELRKYDPIVRRHVVYRETK